MLGSGGRSGVGISRSDDRRIAFAGLVVAATYLAAAAASLTLPADLRLGTWLPVHLALAGAAVTAISAVLPFFTAALVVAPPVHPVLRVGGVTFVALGEVLAILVFGTARGQALPAALAGGTFLIGLGLVAASVFLPLLGALGPRRRLFELAYAIALGNVALGVTIASLFVGGNLLVGTAWASLKPAHAWLNLFGFAALVIVTTLLHLAPTVVGTRLRPRTSGWIAVSGLAVGAPMVALGYVVGSWVLVRTGAGLVLAGAIGVTGHAIVVHRDPDRGRWTTDFGWHRFTIGALLGGQLWLAGGLAIAAARVLAAGPDPGAWSLPLITGPLIVGGIVPIVLGAMTHLLPAIGPGDPIRHAAQRRSLGRGATLRLLGLNLGPALIAIGTGPATSWLASQGSPTGGDILIRLGLGCSALAVGGTLALLARSARPDPRQGPANPRPTLEVRHPSA